MWGAPTGSLSAVATRSEPEVAVPGSIRWPEVTSVSVGAVKGSSDDVRRARVRYFATRDGEASVVISLRISSALELHCCGTRQPTTPA